MTKHSITVVSAGLSEHSASSLLAQQLQASVASALAGYGQQAEFEVFELKRLIPQIGNQLVTGFPQGELAQALGSVRESAGIITVTPVFKASYAGLFKSFWDLVEEDSIRHKPLLLAATGGTARHSLALEFALRPLFAYFQADIVPTAVFVATDDFGAESAMQTRIERAGLELAQKLLGASFGQEPSAAKVSRETAQPRKSPISLEQAEQVDVELMDRTGKVERSGLAELKITPFDQLLKKTQVK